MTVQPRLAHVNRLVRKFRLSYSHLMNAKSERFEMRLSPELIAQLDQWRREQPDLPPRAEAVRRLIELGLIGSAVRS